MPERVAQKVTPGSGCMGAKDPTTGPGSIPRVARPGAVIEVDRNTPPVLFHFGEGVRLEKLPLGARIVYPPDPLEPIAHPERAIKRALAKPLEDDPLKSLLRRGLKIPRAVRAPSPPHPPRAAPPPRPGRVGGGRHAAARGGVRPLYT